MKFRKVSKSSFIFQGTHEVINKHGQKEIRMKAIPRSMVYGKKVYKKLINPHKSER